MNRTLVAGGFGLLALTTMAAKCGSTTTGGAPAASHSGPVSISVTASGGLPGAEASSLSILDGSQQTQHNAAVLPWSTTLTDNPADVGVTAQTSDGSPTAGISCEIDMPGQAPIKNTSTGPYAVVDCNGTNF